MIDERFDPKKVYRNRAFTHYEYATLSIDTLWDELEKDGFDKRQAVIVDERIDGVIYSQEILSSNPEKPNFDPVKLIYEHEDKIKAYVESAIELAAIEGIKEFTYTKTPMTMPDGGQYLVSILHISGPKIQLQKDNK